MNSFAPGNMPIGDPWVRNALAQGMRPEQLVSALTQAGWAPPAAQAHVAAHLAPAFVPPMIPGSRAPELILVKPTRAAAQWPPAAKFLLIASAVLWLVALGLPALVPVGPDDGSTVRGGSAFLLGLLFCWVPFGPWVAWWANPFTLLGVLVIRRPTARKQIVARVFSAAGALTALGVLALSQVPRDEGSSHQQHVTHGPAVYLWLGSIILAVVSVWIPRRLTTSQPAPSFVPGGNPLVR